MRTVFYQKLRHYHWNVQGQDFFELHLKFEEVYNKWVVFIDETIGEAEDSGDRTTVNILDEIRDGLEADRWML
jgi:starvation-inducible DNA-binding protein